MHGANPTIRPSAAVFPGAEPIAASSGIPVVVVQKNERLQGGHEPTVALEIIANVRFLFCRIPIPDPEPAIELALYGTAAQREQMPAGDG